MATSDLQGELAKDGFKTDGETEKKLCHVILQQLDDISGDISGLAVKWCVCTPARLTLMAVSRQECQKEVSHVLCSIQFGPAGTQGCRLKGPGCSRKSVSKGDVSIRQESTAARHCQHRP